MKPARAPVALVADDDATLRMLAAEALRDEGMDVVEVPDGEAALAEFERLQPQLVVIDLMMPGTDGFAVCERIRSHPRGAHVPIIVLTGLDSSGAIDQAFDAGATDFIPKPVNWTLLRYRARYVLRASATTAALAVSERRLLQAQRVLCMASWNWIASTDALSVSETYADLLGVAPRQLSDRLGGVLAHVHPDDREVVSGALDELRAGQPFRLEYRVKRPGGEIRTLCDTAVPELDECGQLVGAHGTLQDISSQVEAERRVRHLAYFDELTGMPNRNAFREALQAMLVGGMRRRPPVAALLLDLSRFGLLNDSLGREAADQVLCIVGQRLRDFVRLELGAGDVSDETELAVAARYGPDQFAVMLCESRGIDPREPVALATRLQEALSAPMLVQRHSLAMKCSVGIATSPDHAADAESLLKCAETALRQAKRDKSQSTILEYSQGMVEHQLSRIRLETAMRSALEIGRGLSLRYQPKVDFATRRIVGAEALLRWQDPALGSIAPADFIPFAEDMGMIVPLSEWVIEAVCRQVAEWREQDVPRVPVAINLSAIHFRFADFLETIVRTLAKHGLDGRDIEFELTESALIGDIEVCSQVLAEMHSRGLRVALDDFGTGYSSLSYLKRLPLAALKIDRSFVREIDSDPTDAAIIASVVSMAASLGMEVVVEGVESAAQARHLGSLGCKLMQGSLFSRPVRADRYVEALCKGLDLWVKELPLAS